MRIKAVIRVGAICAISLPAAGAERSITLVERLGRGWTNELVSYPFDAEPGECLPDSIEVRGPLGPVPCQLTDVTNWPGRGSPFVKSARLQFLVAELPPLTTRTYTVSAGRKNVRPLETDLSVWPRSNTVEITTSRIGLRLPFGGEAYPQPVPAAQAPGPMAALKPGSNDWAGGSALTGAVGVASWKSELLTSGPFVASVRLTYVLADSNTVTVSAQVAAGDNTVRWRLESRDDQPAGGVEWRLPPLPARGLVFKQGRPLPMSEADGFVRLQAGFESGLRAWWTASGPPAYGDEWERVGARLEP